MNARKASSAAVLAQAVSMQGLSDVPVQGLSAAQTLQWLHAWSELGWLRRLDSAWAMQLHRLDASTPPAVLVAAAVLAHMEGRGHSCLSVQALATSPGNLLAWPAEVLQAPLGVLALWRHMPQGEAAWRAALQAAPLACLRLAQAPDQGQPMVLDDSADAPLLYLRRYRAYEERVGQHLRQRAHQPIAVPEPLARQWLDRFFGPSPSPMLDADAPEAQTDWQKLACAVALRAHLSVITGGPGTGKTHTAARLLALLLALHPGPGPLRMALAAPTGKAAARLKQSIEGSLQALQAQVLEAQTDPGVASELDLVTLIQRMGPARTLHSLLGAQPDSRLFRHHAGHPLDVDVLIVDEASMVHLEMMDTVLQALPPTARLVLLGDKDQLASVEAGAVLGEVCRDAAQGAYLPETLRYADAVAGQRLAPAFHAGAHQAVSALAQQTVMLRHSRRFDGPIGQLALAVNAGDTVGAWACFNANPTDRRPVLALQPDAPQAVCAMALGASGQHSYRDYLQCLRQGPEGQSEDAHAGWVRSVLRAFDRFRILCAVHQGEWGTAALNVSVQKSLADTGWLQPQGEWFAGRPVMVTRNDAQLGVFNGDVGVVLPNPQGVLKVWFLDGEQLRSVRVSRLAHAETAFAMTVHKSQGSEFAHTVLVLPAGAAEVLTRELVYTGITRAREQFTLVEGQAGLFNAALARPSVRASGLRGWWR